MIKFKWETEFKKTEIGEIPGEWDIVELGKLADIKTGKTNVQDAVESGEYPLFDRSYEFKKSNKYLFDTEAVIVPGEGKDFLPRYYIGKFDLHQRTYAIFNFQQNLKGKYLYFTMFILRYYLREWAVGSTVLSLRLPLFKQLPIPLPPPPEQSRIATVLSWFDDLIENKKRQNEILEKVAMAIFKSWFVDFEPFKDEEFVYSEELGKEIPKGWEVQGVSAFADISLGGTPKREESKYWNGSIKWATAKDVANTKGIYILETAEYISEEGLNHSNAKILPQDSIIITARGTVGEIRLLGEAISFNQTCYGLIPKNNIGTYYLFLSLKHTLHEIKALSYGTVFDTITMKTFDEMKILVPPPPIIQKFHSLVEPLFQKIILNQKQIMVLRKVRDALLPMLVFGRLRVVEVY